MSTDAIERPPTAVAAAHRFRALGPLSLLGASVIALTVIQHRRRGRRSDTVAPAGVLLSGGFERLVGPAEAARSGRSSTLWLDPLRDRRETLQNRP